MTYASNRLYSGIIIGSQVEEAAAAEGGEEEEGEGQGADESSCSGNRLLI